METILILGVCKYQKVENPWSRQKSLLLPIVNVLHDESILIKFNLTIQSNLCTVPTVGTQKSGFFQKWLLFRGWALKNTIKLGITLAIVDRWPLFRGGCKHRFDKRLGQQKCLIRFNSDKCLVFPSMEKYKYKRYKTG